MQDAWNKCSVILNHKRLSTLIIHKAVNYKTINISKFIAINNLVYFTGLPLFLIAIFYCAGS